MDGYKLLADSYREYLEKNPEEHNRLSLECAIKALDTVAGCTKDDICALYDTGCFTEITLSYTKKALINCGIPTAQVDSVMHELKWLHDTVGASSIV